MYLTDYQFIELLKRAKTRLSEVKRIVKEDSDTTGAKYTYCNVGLCDEHLTTKDTAMWPEDFPGRKTMKYRRAGHKCPMDYRSFSDTDLNGCFYTCRIFKRGLRNLKHVKALYDNSINYYEKSLGSEKIVG